MNAVAGSRNKPTLDAPYAEECAELAESLGWDAGSVRHWFNECALMRRYEQKWPASVAEWAAWRDVIALFDKRGAEPD